MGVCSSCGATTKEGAAYCGQCGKPVVAASQAQASYTPVQAVGSEAQASYTPVQVPTPPPAGFAASQGLSSNAAAALAYLLGFVSGILFLLLEPYNHDRFVRFHAFQSIIYCVACIVFHIAWSVVTGILIHFAAFILLLSAPLHLLVSLGLFGYWLFLMFQAYQQKEYRIPLIGAIAARQVA